MPCLLCGCENMEVINKGTRDIQDIEVLKCRNCGLVFLSKFDHITDRFYEENGMYQDATIKNLAHGVSLIDVVRRVGYFKEGYLEKRVLDFGCGNGSFLENVSPYVKSVMGVELEKNAVDSLIAKNIEVKSNLKELSGKFDLITMFHVIEHITEPERLLGEIYETMDSGGELLVETPNADDALITLYNCDAFKKFTYWGCHVILYTTETLEQMLKKIGFKIIKSTQIQKYPMENHLYWILKGLPGGQKVLGSKFDAKTQCAYEELLRLENRCDTLLVRVCKE